MPLRKISEPSRRERCLSREHNPPNMMVYQPGCYEWECPSCGHITAFSVPLITCEKNRYTEEGGFLPRPRKYYISDYNKDDIARLPCKDENNIWFTTYI